MLKCDRKKVGGILLEMMGAWQKKREGIM